MKLLLMVFLLTLVTLPLPGIAGTLDINVNGVLGELLQGNDAVGLTGIGFSATGTIDPDAAPVSIAGDSYTYDLAGYLQIMLGKIAMTGYDAQITLTAPLSGPDTVVLDFGVTEFGITPEVEAYLTLPAGTLDGPWVQPFQASFSEPDSSLTYGVPGEEDVIYATLGMTGTASIGGAPAAQMPEPGPAGLLAGGRALAIGVKKAFGA